MGKKFVVDMDDVFEDGEDVNIDYFDVRRERQEKMRRKTELRRLMEDRQERLRLSDLLGMHIPDEWISDLDRSHK